jgi:hypothetical protein
MPIMLFRSTTLASLLALGGSALHLGGCALYPGGGAHEPSLRTPDPAARLPPDYAWPPLALAEGAPQLAAAEQAKTAWSPVGVTNAAPADQVPQSFTPVTPPTNPGDCLARLGQAGVRYDSLDARRGVVTPIQVTSDLGGIRYVPTGGLPLVMDCRFALTLTEVGPILRELGVSALHYSGAYVYRMSSKGRLSLHANGLAIDVHAVTVNGQELSVKKSFAKGLGDSCESNFPPLNRVACHLKRTGAFREFLTPDYNADHHDHLHLAISP